MPRTPVDSHVALNVLDAFTFGDKVLYVPCENLLNGKTLESVELESQSGEIDEGDDAGEAAATDVTVTEVTVLAGDTDVYEGSRVADTITAETGFSFRITGGEAALYSLTFSFEDSDGDTDGITVMVRMR